MKFHLAHIVPSKTMHGLNGYREVIDTVQWGLQELGHTATCGLNALAPDATNIVFGAQVMEMPVLSTLPPQTIVYNFEQARGARKEEVKPQMLEIARRFRIWDYSSANVQAWTGWGAKDVRVVPVGYAPVLQRIDKPAEQDIDVLIYGMPAPNRMGAFHFLSYSGLTAVFVCGLYGKARDDLIARSKMVLNINVYDTAKIFEVVRVSYLLANRKCVVADVDADTQIDADMRSAIRIADPAQLVPVCQALAANASARASLEEAGFAAIAKRDIRQILQTALA